MGILLENIVPINVFFQESSRTSHLMMCCAPIKSNLLRARERDMNYYLSGTFRPHLVVFCTRHIVQYSIAVLWSPPPGHSSTRRLRHVGWPGLCLGNCPARCFSPSSRTKPKPFPVLTASFLEIRKTFLVKSRQWQNYP